MKTLIKFSIVIMVLLMAKSSIIYGKVCSTKLEWPTSSWTRITVSGDYIDIDFDVYFTSFTGYPKATLYANGNNTQIELSSGRNDVSPGEYLIQWDCNAWIASATANITYECSSNSGPSNSDNPSPNKSNSGSPRTNTYNSGNNQSSTQNHGTYHSDNTYRLNKFWPSENVILAELREYNCNDYSTSINEAKDMLLYLGANNISLLTSTYVSGTFSTGAEITIWPNTYNKRFCYGIRYGKPLSGRPYFGSNDTYFEVCK